MASRVRDTTGPFVPSPEQAFHALLHATLADGRPSLEQVRQLAQTAQAIGAPAVDYADPVTAAAVLDDFLDRHDYRSAYALQAPGAGNRVGRGRRLGRSTR